MKYDEYVRVQFGVAANAWERLLCLASVGCGAPGAGGLAAGLAALHPYVGELAASEPEESLTEAIRQPITGASSSCGWGGGDRCQRNTGALWTVSV